MTSQPRADRGYTRVVGSRARRYLAGGLVAGGVWFAVLSTSPVQSQVAGPVVLDPELAVSTVVSGLTQPIGMAFIGRNDIFVLEKASGKVQRVINGLVQTTPALDLAVNSASERGLLSIALHPRFPRNPRVYLYWTESTAVDAAGARVDSTVVANTPLLGNRVDSFIWNGTALRFERNLIKLRAFQEDAGQPPRGNHNGGIIRFAVNRGDHDRDRDHGRDDRDDDRHGAFSWSRADGRRRARSRRRRPRSRSRQAPRRRPRQGSAVHHHRRQRPARADAEPRGRPDWPRHAGRPVRRTPPRQRPPHGRGAAPQRRRHDAPRQSVLRPRPPRERRGRREPPEDLRVRRPQQLRHGRGSDARVSCGTRRTATTPSTRSTASPRGRTTGGCR